MSAVAEPADPQLGQGWPFPPRWGGGGTVELVAGEEKLRQAVLLLLRTEIDERVMRPGYGCGIESRVFEPTSGETLFRIQDDVRRALLLFEPRVHVDTVVAEAAEGRIDVLIEYRTDPHRRLQSLIFPFYLETAA